MLRQEKKGFTLIELLIVVAIIAILAAIAVPNFLEAQVRAKVSRAKSDLRTIATAMESYGVDHNVAPPAPAIYAQPACVSDVIRASDLPTRFPEPGNTVNPGWPTFTAFCEKRLTTPIAYITSLLYDPFREKGSVGNAGGVASNDSERYYVYTSWQSCQTGQEPNAIMAVGYTWAWRSVGPSRTSVTNVPGVLLDQPALTGNKAWQNNYIYDPSNGTVSKGAIIRTNKGDCTGPFK